MLRKVLADRILYSKRQVGHGHCFVRQTYAALYKRFLGSLRTAATGFAQNTAHHNNFTHRRKLINKLRRLCESSRWNEFSSTSSIANLSNAELNCNETIHIGFGISFNSQPDKGDLITTVASFSPPKARSYKMPSLTYANFHTGTSSTPSQQTSGSIQVGF